MRSPEKNDVQQRDEDRDDANDEYDFVDGGHCSVFSLLRVSIFCLSQPSVVASNAGDGLYIEVRKSCIANSSMSFACSSVSFWMCSIMLLVVGWLVISPNLQDLRCCQELGNKLAKLARFLLCVQALLLLSCLLISQTQQDQVPKGF